MLTSKVTELPSTRIELMYNEIPNLMLELLPILLVPRESFQAILKSVGEDLTMSGSRLSLTIPYNTDLLSYYEAKLLRDVTVEKRLTLTLAIPLVSRTTITPRIERKWYL